MPPQCAAGQEERGWIPEVDKGCCCSLKGCCQVQAVLVVAMSLLYVPSLLIEYLQPNVMKCPTRIDHENGMVMIHSPFDCEWERRGEVAHAKTAELVVKILLQSIAFGAAILFLIGIRRRRPKLLLPYVRVLGVHMVFNSVALLVKACVYNLWAEAILFILPVGIGIPYYMWICAYSLYRKMKLAAPEAPPPMPVSDSSGPVSGSGSEAGAAVPVRIYAPPPGFVLPPGYGYAPPGAGYVAGYGPSFVAGFAPGAPHDKGDDDSPPPPYDVVVAAGEAGVVAGMTGVAPGAASAGPPKAVVPNAPSQV